MLPKFGEFIHCEGAVVCCRIKIVVFGLIRISALRPQAEAVVLVISMGLRWWVQGQSLGWIYYAVKRRNIPYASVDIRKQITSVHSPYTLSIFSPFSLCITGAIQGKRYLQHAQKDCGTLSLAVLFSAFVTYGYEICLVQWRAHKDE